MAAESDIIIICCALNDQTKGIFDKDVFGKMKKTANIINVARGPVVNQEDLIKALKVMISYKEDSDI